MIGYHGTSADNLQSILDNGILANPENRNWTVSQNEVYFWGDNYISSECFDEDEDMDDEQRSCVLINQAVESAMCALAVAKDCRILILEIEVPDDEVDTDYSCENMQHANSIPRDVKPEEIRRMFISQDLSMLRGLFIANMRRMNLSGLQFSEFEELVADCFDDFVCYDLSDVAEVVEFTPEEMRVA